MAMIAARSAIAGLVLSTTTDSPAPSASARTRRWRASRPAAFGHRSLLMWPCDAAKFCS